MKNCHRDHAFLSFVVASGAFACALTAVVLSLTCGGTGEYVALFGFAACALMFVALGM